MKIKAFTLVELLVSISILSILGTIGYISLTGYKGDARDAKRVSDIYEIEDSLNLYKMIHLEYPKPSYGDEISYSGKILWTQGVFGKSIITGLKGVSKVPKDPLENIEYTYSLLNNGLEFQIATVIEGKLTKKERFKVNSDDSDFARTYVKGNFNGYISETNIGGINYILSTPSIISSDSSILDYYNLVSTNNLSYNSATILPYIFEGGNYNVDGNGFEQGINLENIVAYSGSYINLDSLEFVNNLINSYSGSTILNTSDRYKYLTNINGNIYETDNFVENILGIR